MCVNLMLIFLFLCGKLEITWSVNILLQEDPIDEIPCFIEQASDWLFAL